MSALSALAQHISRRPQRIALLAQIAEQGSISRAAKSVGMSYKAAWEAVDELNNLAGIPLVLRSVGGKGGGGAQLSAEGLRLLALYRRLEALQAELLQAAEDDADLRLLGRLMLRTSARNQLSGTVRAIRAQGRNDLVELELPGGLPLVAQITHANTQRLELALDRPAVALLKAGWIELHAAEAQLPAELNCLPGRIEAILEDPQGPSEVRLALPGGQTLCALVEPARLQALGLGVDSPALAAFAPRQVLLGTPP